MKRHQGVLRRMAVIEQVQKDIWTGRIVAVEDVPFFRQFGRFEQGIVLQRPGQASIKILGQRINIERAVSVGKRHLAMFLEMEFGIFTAID